MAVYTEVPDDELEAFLADYDIGRAASCKGIAEGVENTNYLLHTERGSYILTLYEKRVKPADLPFFLGLMEHLAGKGITCPTPIHAAGRRGAAASSAAGRPPSSASWTACGRAGRRRAIASRWARRWRSSIWRARTFALKRPNALSLGGLAAACFEACRERAR